MYVAARWKKLHAGDFFSNFGSSLSATKPNLLKVFKR